MAEPLALEEACCRVQQAMDMGTDPCWQAGILAGLAARLPQTGEVAASIRRLDEAHRAALPEAYAAAVILLQWLLRGAPR